jgi:hypothetical protein
MPRSLPLVLSALALCLLAPAAASAYEPIGGDFRISTVGTDGATNREPISQTIAYNPQANEYLVVWQGDGLTVDEENEIFGQRLSATGAEIGGDFRISNVGSDGDVSRTAGQPNVEYDSIDNQYLVVWNGDGLATNNEFEVFGQRLSATGTELGTDFRISTAGSDGDAGRVALGPHLAYNPTDGEYLVTWTADGLATNEEFEIFGQRIRGSDGAELGTNDFRISNVGTDTQTTRRPFESDVAYSPAGHEYLVVWNGDGLATDEEFEIFGQRVSATGAEIGADFRISNVGSDGDIQRGASQVEVAYGSGAGEYLAVYQGDDGPTANDDEILGRRISETGDPLGTDDFQISNTGPTDASTADLAYSPIANEYMVTWDADPFVGDDIDIYGQELTASGSQVGGDFQVSHAGIDGETSRFAGGGAIAFGTGPNEFIATWEGDELPTDNEFEIFGHRLAIVPPVAEQPAAPAAVPPNPLCATLRKKLKQAKKAGRTANVRKLKRKLRGLGC